MARIQHADDVSRRGVALLIVIAMLALFATVGLSFVFYAEMEADAARFRRQAEDADLDAERLLSFGLGQLIFGVDRTKNTVSKMAGNSLGESMYGIPGGTTPFNGIGRPHPDTTTSLASLTPFEGINVPYTYPDLNNPFLATMDANGVIQSRSFFRNNGSLRPAALGTAPEGDVRNVESAASINGGYVNDAFWMDLGHPIMTNKDGIRYKPLFAFTVIDLDGRVNLSVTGNYLADYNTPGITSRCGLGPIEINPSKVLTTDRTEISRIFRGSTNPASRFGATGTGDTPDNTVALPPTKFYSRVDYTGTSKSIPAQPTASYSQFPTFGTWNDAAPGSGLGYDYFAARVNTAGGAADAALSLSNVDGLLRWRDRGLQAASCDLFKLLPKNLAPTGSTVPAAVNMVTPLSSSFDTAHWAPFLIADPNTKFELKAAPAYPVSSLGATPTVAAAGGVGDFTTSFQSIAAAELRRINLNRGFTSMQANAAVGMKERTDMAQEIFNRLIRVTGALPPSPGFPFQPATPTDSQFRATRWLAQLAVNMVDFIDDDDVMTVFNWNPKADPNQLEAGDFVFGVEMNKLLINEVYATADNDKTNDPGLADLNNPNGTKYRLNVWAELYNPMSAAAANNGVVTLTVNNKPRYRMLLAKDTVGVSDDGTGTSPSTTGTPTNLLYDTNDPSTGVVDWPADKSTVSPGDQSASGNGFYLVAPPNTTLLDDRKPTFTPQFDHTSQGMSSKLFDMPANVNSIPTSLASTTLVLQRLADVSRDEQNDATKPGYNPFITVDFSPVTIAPAVKYFNMTPPPMNFAFGALNSYGRFQPLQATGMKKQTPMKADGTTPQYDPMGTEPQHTFRRQNSKMAGTVTAAGDTLKQPFDAYYHLDRPLISTGELLHVPSLPASQLTQKFPGSITCYAAMYDPSSLLGRFLETVTVGDRSYNKYLTPSAPGTVVGAGKQSIIIPGKININTIVDKKVLEAIFDVQTDPAGKSFFTQADVDFFWTNLKNITNTRPIAGFADYTLSGNNVTLQKSMFDLFQGIPQTTTGMTEYEKAEPIRKVMNSISFTSNTFAVWMTVGLFEVDSSNNIKANGELGKSENRQVRRRFFSVVDRSHMILPDTQLTTLTNAVNKGANSATLAAATGSVTGAATNLKVDYSTWTLRAGMALTIDKGLGTEETVMIKQITGNSIQVGAFSQSHAAGATVHFGGIRGPQVPVNFGTNNYVLGYPGPQPNFTPKDYPYLVPYYTLID